MDQMTNAAWMTSCFIPAKICGLFEPGQTHLYHLNPIYNENGMMNKKIIPHIKIQQLFLKYKQGSKNNKKKGIYVSGIKGKEMTGSSHWDIKLLGILLKCCQNNFPRLQLGMVKACFLLLGFDILSKTHQQLWVQGWEVCKQNFSIFPEGNF